MVYLLTEGNLADLAIAEHTDIEVCFDFLYLKRVQSYNEKIDRRDHLKEMKKLEQKNGR